MARPASRSVAATLHEARTIMVEGESGLLAIAPPHCSAPHYEPSLRRLSWPSGATGDALFGERSPTACAAPTHSHGWADEIAKWENGP
jgi:phage terminase large subunit-like protein